MTIDILMITYNRPQYTRLSLGRLLDSCDETMRVWVWQNGNDSDTIDVVNSFRGHPRFFKYHHSLENKKLNKPTNWLWDNAEGQFLGKVDDDCLVLFEWAQILRTAHLDEPRFGVIGCWNYFPQDVVPEIASVKIKTFNKGHQLLQNCWIGGSGYLMKRQCVNQLGLLDDGHNFSAYCIKLWSKGWINGWYYPLIYQEHMDDPRSQHTQLRTDEDLKNGIPLTAKNFRVSTIEQWLEFLKNDAVVLQKASLDSKKYSGWRMKMNRLGVKLKTCGGRL
ncbi:MAG: glycosyltransferase family A protein [Phycisphaerae bacterium]|nr:glycosyltransferase family A protein [Phycisphaerae bacterium]